MAVKERCRFYGGYSFAQRFLVIVDPELAKDVMVKNFHCFVDRSARNSESFLIHTGTLEDEVNLRQFIANKGEAWKEQRATFSPIFTSGKLKGMFGLVLDTSERLMRSLDRYAEDGKGFEAKDLFGKYRSVVQTVFLSGLIIPRPSHLLLGKNSSVLTTSRTFSMYFFGGGS